MNLNDLLRAKDIDPKRVVVMRHRPAPEPPADLQKTLPWLAAENPHVFNAYQQTQTERVEKTLQDAAYVASFLGREPGTALFVALYAIAGWKPLTRERFWAIPANVELKALGSRGFRADDPRTSILWFDLQLTDFYAEWKGKLILGWPPPERSWWRRAHKNVMPVVAILPDSALDAALREWDQIDLSWQELTVIPSRLRAKLSEWRAIYYIFDTSDATGYVGSAYGSENLLGRWRNYAASGHGGNKLLRQRDPNNLRFTILQRVSPDMDSTEVIRLESSWKERLHTRHPFGLNDN